LTPVSRAKERASEKHAVRPVFSSRTGRQQVPGIAHIRYEFRSPDATPIKRVAGVQLADPSTIRSWMAWGRNDGAPISEDQADHSVAERRGSVTNN